MRTAVLNCLVALCAAVAPRAFPQADAAKIVALDAVPQIRETPGQRDARMQWFRDAKFGMFIHWGPCSVGQKEIGWGRQGNRPWDINQHGPRTSDPVYDAYFKEFNPTHYDADAWVRFAKESGMKYMVLIAKHHDGFSQFDSFHAGADVPGRPARFLKFETRSDTPRPMLLQRVEVYGE